MTHAPAGPATTPGGARRRPAPVRTAALIALALGLAGALVAGALVAVRATWPQASIDPAASALARVAIAPFGERAVSARAIEPDGGWLPVRLRGGVVMPLAAVAGDTRLRLTVTVRRAGWLGWLIGGTEVVHAVVRTPAAHVASSFVYPAAGAPVRVRFSSPVRVVSVRTPGRAPTLLHLAEPSRMVAIGITATGAALAGTALVAGAPERWERLPAPVRVSWFGGGPAPQVLVRPAPSTRLTPRAGIVLTFSRPVAAVLGAARPTLLPPTSGGWHQPNPNTLVFVPTGLGFPLGRRVHLELPRAIEVIAGGDPAETRALSWQVPRPSLLRLRQLLAELGYLPLRWRPADAAVPRTPAAQVRAALAPPAGSFLWRFARTPSALKSIWASGDLRPVLLRGAIMAFETAHGMNPDGFPSLDVFRALLGDELAARRADAGYSYVYVSETLPQTLTLWHDGRVVLTTPVNTGIPSRPTALGTYPVYAHLTVTTMQGTNPDGSHYNDPGVPWVNYFNGGDAVHGFVRGSYGWPQSLGCVEVPIPTAAQIFPYVQVGTLVTVTA